ncbi:MAG: alpha/beta hydrolase [Pyrinomonadaceae bacterium]|nr:alpha/beta hydrolase [Pyrinomonadaceae bacterium]
MRATPIILVVLLASMSASRENAAQQQSAKTPSLVLSPCNVEGTPEKVKCGTYEVYENRDSKKGRKISLKVVVFPATGQEREPDPFVYVPGGPGSSATEDAPYVAPQFAKIREHRDLLFVDQRGTGGSHPLNCNFYNPADIQSYFGYFFPLEDVRKCREQLEQKADLTLYTTPIAMDDLDEVRAALGYLRLNLFGGSYGTRASLVYLKRHPKHVRTVTLQGVAPTNQYMPRDFAQSMERALQGILAECGADEACNRAFPNLRAETQAVLERLIQGPVEVEVRKNFDRGGDNASSVSRPEERVKIKLSRDLAVEAVRYMLYHPGGASRAPLLLHQAAQGNFVPIAEAALSYRRNLVGSGANGMYLSVTCAEDLPWIKPGEGERLAANTFLGGYRLRQQREACALWPRATIPSDYGEPVRASAPVLIFTGEWDPVTPPSNGDAAARHLPNSLHVMVPQGAHGFGGLEGIDCIQRLNTEFVEKGTVKGLDTSCVKNIRRKGFIVAP